MIHVHELTKQYAGRTAVSRLSFDVEAGEIVGFLGPNGAGKSTTMRILSGYMPPTSGMATVDGHDVFRESLEVRRKVGYMPEMAPLYHDMRVKEYLHFRAELKGLRGRDLRFRTGEVMELCAVTDVRRRVIGNLSKGFKQRVALADALIHRPKLLILDEPTNGLDPTQIRGVRELLRGLREQHTILLSTHILHEVEQTCDRVIMIHEGKIQACDTPRNLTRSLRATSLVHVELQSASDVARELEALPGVRKVMPSKTDKGWRAYAMRVESQTDIREAILDLATARGWRIRELHRQLPTLEDVFVELAAADWGRGLLDKKTMRVFWTLLKKELRAFFVSPVAYIVLALVMVLGGVSFKAALSVLESAPSEGSIVTWTFHAQWFWLSYFFVFPLLTMRLFAEEKKLGTLETLFTAPVRAWQVVGAKFMAALVLYAVIWLPSLGNFGLLDWITGGKVDIPEGALRGSYLILFAMGIFNLAMGCFASSLTSNQIVAAVISFTLSVLHFLLGVFALVVGRRLPESMVEAVHYVASVEHIRLFTQGLIDTRPLIYYASLTLLFLTLTHQVVEFRRWRL